MNEIIMSKMTRYDIKMEWISCIEIDMEKNLYPELYIGKSCSTILYLAHSVVSLPILMYPYELTEWELEMSLRSGGSVTTSREVTSRFASWVAAVFVKDHRIKWKCNY